MKTVVVYEDLPICNLITIAEEFVDELMGRGVYVVGTNFSTAAPSVTTARVHISFVNNINKLVGRQFDEVFTYGQANKANLYGYLKERAVERERFDGPLIDYVMIEEGVK